MLLSFRVKNGVDLLGKLSLMEDINWVILEDPKMAKMVIDFSEMDPLAHVEDTSNSDIIHSKEYMTPLKRNCKTREITNLCAEFFLFHIIQKRKSF